MEEILKTLIKNGLTPDQLFCMISLREGLNYPQINYEKECQVLMNKNFTHYDEGYVLTAKGKMFLLGLDKFFRKTKTKEPDKDFLENIKKYVDIFPIGRQGNQPIRCSPKALSDRFQWFFSEYDYTWEEVLNATETYVKACESDSYKYIKTSKNFVKKEDTVGKRTISSILADWCEAVRNDEVVVRGSKYFGENIV